MENLEPVRDFRQISLVASLAKAIWTDHYAPIIGIEQVNYMVERFQSVQAIAQQIEQGYHYYLIVCEEVYAGYFSFRLDSDRLFLSKFYVSADFRGRGLGHLTMDFIATVAKSDNLNII